jgi:DNA polymerase-1
MAKKLYLIDGYGFVFRAYHSMPPLTDPKGVPVGAVYGFTNMLIKLLKDHKPDYMAVAFDSGKETFRTQMYSAYKANRPPAPDDLIPQFPLVRDVVEAVGLKSFELVGYEADDVIATFTKRAREQDIEVTIVSSDKDLMQLVKDGQVQMYDPVRQKYVGEKEVLEKFGVTPAKVLDACALIGDSSDNVPGAPGIGPKTAAELITQFNSLDELLLRTAEIKQPKRREVLESHREQILLSRELIRLHFDVPLTCKFDEMAAVHDDARLGDFCLKHGFKSLAAKLGTSSLRPEGSNPEPQLTPWIASATPRNDEVVKSIDELTKWASGKTKLASFFADYGVALAHENEARYLKYGSSGTDLFDTNPMNQAAVLAALTPILQNPAVLNIFHDFKSHYIQGVQGFDDVQVMEYVSATGIKNGELAEIKLGKKSTDDEIAAAAFAHVHEIWGKHGMLKAELQRVQQTTIYEKIEKRMIHVLARMEKKGAKIDANYLRGMSAHFAEKLAVLEKEIHAMAGAEFNIGSPAQLGDVLFEKLGLAGGRKSKKTGQYSTGADVLEDLSLEGHEIAAKILEWRQLSKLKSTYTDALPLQVNLSTGRVHTTFAMTVANTGRLSSQNPNLQNIPIRSEEGKKIRNAFIAAPGYKLISADYSQIELRLLAHVANIEPLIEAFKNGEDVHKATARQVFGVTEVDDNHRRMAKTINFGIIYGLSAHGLAERLRIPRHDAAEFIAAYFRQYPGIKEYMNRTIAECKDNGYVETITGRKMHIRGINDKNGAIRQFSERAAINAPLQGGAADIIKKAMIELHKQNFPMTLQVHDELLFEVAEAEAEEMRNKVVQIMENPIQLSVPILVEAHIGNNWGEAH